MHFDDLPRVTLGHLPTPLEPLAIHQSTPTGPRVLVKRDDCTGLAFGGNKTRKLEYLLADAEQQGATAIVTFGALQSNHARQTAAACARRGLECALILRDAVGRQVDDYARNANLLYDDLFGAAVHRVPRDSTPEAMLKTVLSELAEAGHRSYVVPTGGSSEVGALGYARCALEIAAEFKARGLYPGAVIHATSTGGTQGGLVAGFRYAGLATRVLGINVYKTDSAAIAAEVKTLGQAVLDRLDPTLRLTDKDVEVLDGFLGEGYGKPTAAMVQALRRLASKEGLLFDPVYSGKALAGLLALLEADRLSDDVVFIHTGGAAALPVYASEFLGP
ncbi:MAG: D-cysteine desulfhydrase family protein [Pseudomonadota bacterium]|nr:D-cysteine desulfhydrase family protein [Pseudomonadota bacterium]